jgi:hypothetical protein
MGAARSPSPLVCECAIARSPRPPGLLFRSPQRQPMTSAAPSRPSSGVSKHVRESFYVDAVAPAGRRGLSRSVNSVAALGIRRTELDCLPASLLVMASSSYPDPVVPGKFSQLGDKEVDHRASTGLACGTDLSSYGRLSGCAGPRRRCSVGQTVPTGRPGPPCDTTEPEIPSTGTSPP